MSKIVKKMKIMQPGGTLSDYVPIGAEAENINVDGESVEAKLGKKPYYYNTVADMKADTKLKAGDMVVTLGYYKANDGGGAEYKIVSGNYTDDGGSIHKLTNGLFAELINNDYIFPEYFGTKGDGETDDTINFKKALNYAIINNYNFIALKKYVINDTLLINSENLSIEINELINHAYVETLINIVNNYNTIKINNIITDINSQYAINLNGSYGHGCKQNKLYVKSIKNFNVAVLLLGQGNLGTIYNTLNIKYINCGIGILLKNLTKNDYVNSNYFYDIDINASDTCIKTENVEDGNDFDDNNFYNISLNNYQYGIYLNNAKGNNFYGIRNFEIPQNSTIVYCDSLSDGNRFNFANYCIINKLNILGNRNVFYNELRTTAGKLRAISSYYVSNNKFIVNENLALTNESPVQYGGYNQNYDFSNAIIYNPNMVILIGGNLGSTYTLKINEVVKELTQIYVKVDVSNNSKVNIVDENDNMIQQNITTSGLYLLKYDGSKWVLK